VGKVCKKKRKCYKVCQKLRKCAQREERMRFCVKIPTYYKYFNINVFFLQSLSSTNMKQTAQLSLLHNDFKLGVMTYCDMFRFISEKPPISHKSKFGLNWMVTWAQFHQHNMYCFYARRS